MAPAVVETRPEESTVPSKGQPHDRVKQNEQIELGLADSYGAPDVYIDGENDTCWYHWTGTIYVKILRMENRKGCYIIKLKTDPHAELGKHRHRGEVRAYTIKGNWGYHEYDWVGKPGDYVTEMPGTIHTLYMGEDSEVIFDVTGSIEFFNDDNTLRETMDSFSFWRMYLDHCKENNLKVNEKLWY